MVIEPDPAMVMYCYAGAIIVREMPCCAMYVVYRHRADLASSWYHPFVDQPAVQDIITHNYLHGIFSPRLSMIAAI